jgi:hypothetical protein
VVEPRKDVSQRQRRANWVGLRTLRQRPKLVGTTGDGEPIYEVRSVRLVLLGMSPHFNRLAPCTRCGRELPGAPVMSPADLDAELRHMICADCVRVAGVISVWDPEPARRAARGAPAPEGDDADGALPEPPAGPGAGIEPAAPPAAQAPTPPPEPGIEPVVELVAPVGAPAPGAVAPAPGPPVAPGPAVAPGPDERVAAMERHLRAVTARINELGHLAAAQQARVEERRRLDAEEAAARQAAVDQALADLRAELTSVAGREDAAEAQGVEDRLNEALAGLSRLVASQQGDIATVATKLAETGSDVRRLAEVTEELALDHHALGRRVAEGHDAAALGGVDRRLDELAQTVQTLERRVDDGPAPASDVAGLDGRLGELARAHEALEHRLLSDLDARSERQRAELDAIEAGAATRATQFLQGNEELAREQVILDRRLEALAGQLERLAGRIEELVAWTGPAGERLDALERGLQEALRTRSRRPESPRNGGDEASARAPGVMASGPPGSLLESLDRQLEAAASRLAARSEPDPRR